MNIRLHIFAGQLAWIVSVLRGCEGKSVQGVPGVGRNLLIRSFPEVEDIQSQLYEVQMIPYLYDYERVPYPQRERTQKQIDLSGGAAGRAAAAGGALQAVVSLQAAGESGVGGQLLLTQVVPNGPVTLEGNVTGLPPGRHGLHVHQRGALVDGCAELGPHFIAFYGRHGGPRDHVRHVGDLGNIQTAATEGAPTAVRIVDHLISLAGPRSVVGRSLAVSREEDDYGRAGTDDSALTGSSGPPLACGIIGYLN